MKITILREAELRECIHLDQEVIAAVEDGFTPLANGQATVPPIIGIEVPERRGEVDIKTAYLHGLDSFAVKIASGFFDNERSGLPVSSGMMLVMSAKTGYAEAILLDNGYLTQVRTGAAGAIAAKYLAPKAIVTAGVIGAGLQGRFQAMGLWQSRRFERLLVYDIDREKTDRYLVELRDLLGIEVIGVDEPRTVVEESQAVVTTTPSRVPYLKAEWLHPCLHITAMGSDMEDKQELYPEVLGRADRVFCDLRAQCFARGELHHALEDGILSREDSIIELGDLTSGRAVGRKDEQEITVCDLTGVGVQDTAIALLAYRKALAAGYGMEIEA